jgi:hypothetical protein
MKIRHFLLLIVVLMSLLAFGCAPARSGMEYLSTGGGGEISGSLSGMKISAVVELSGGGESVCVEYLSPESLRGLKLTAKNGSCEVCLGDVRFTCDSDEVVGFLRPATAFLLYGDANSVQKEGENTVLTFPSGSTLTLSPKGEPLSLMGEDVDLHVVWWQSGTSANLGS